MKHKALFAGRLIALGLVSLFFLPACGGGTRPPATSAPARTGGASADAQECPG